MKEFRYTVMDPLGMHARPAGIFVKEASSCESSVRLTKGEKSVDAKKIFGVMGLLVKCGDEVTVTVEGPDEAEVAMRLEEFMKNNL